MPLPRFIARLNRYLLNYLLNPLVRLMAGRMPRFAIVRHMGRRSGRLYSTPINIFKIPEGFIVALTYGADTDWVRNVIATGGCTIRYLGLELELTQPAFVSTAEMAVMPFIVLAILRASNTSEFLRLRSHGCAQSSSGELSPGGAGGIWVVRPTRIRWCAENTHRVFHR